MKYLTKKGEFGLIALKLKNDEFGNFEKDQGSTYVAATAVVMTTQLGREERQLWVVTREQSLWDPTMCHLYWNRMI